MLGSPKARFATTWPERVSVKAGKATWISQWVTSREP